MQLKHDHLHRFVCPRLDHLVWILIYKATLTYMTREEILEDRYRLGRRHLCLHLVQPIEHFWRQVIRRRVVYRHPSVIAKGNNLPPSALSRKSYTISDNNNHIDTVDYLRSTLVCV